MTGGIRDKKAVVQLLVSCSALRLLHEETELLYATLYSSMQTSVHPD